MNKVIDSKKELKKGDRVLIRDKTHPWYGHVGEVGQKVSNMPGMYRVELENGMAAGCYEHQLEVL